MKPIPYSEVAVGAAFKVLRPEYRRDRSWTRSCHAKNPRETSREIKNNSTYLKISNGHSHDLVKKCDAIFPLNIPCRVLPVKVNMPDLIDWAIVNQGSVNHG